MKLAVINPVRRRDFEVLAEQYPLALAPVMGKTYLERVIEGLVRKGVKELTVLEADRLERVKRVVNDGKKWGIDANVVDLPCEMGPETVRSQDVVRGKGFDDVQRLDDLVGEASVPSFLSAREWFNRLLDLLPELSCDLPGMVERRPGVWVGEDVKVGVGVEFNAPCWVGVRTTLGPEAVIGSGTIVEPGSYIDVGAEISNSHVGPETYVGSFADLRDSLAWGRGLVNWKTGASLTVFDTALLGASRSTDWAIAG